MQDQEMIIYNAKILDIVEEYKGVKTYTIEKPEGLKWEEGASFHLAMPGFNDGDKIDKKLVHHLSISTLEDDDVVRFTTKFPVRKSIFKKALLEKKVGDYLQFYKIRSHMALRREEKTLVLLSMGIGLTTMRPLINKFKKDPSGIKKLVSVNVNRKDTHLFEAEISEIKDKLFEQVWLDSRNNFFEMLKGMNIEDSIFYVVGSNEFLLDSIYILKDMGVSEENIMLDMNEANKEILFKASKNHKFL